MDHARGRPGKEEILSLSRPGGDHDLSKLLSLSRTTRREIEIRQMICIYSLANNRIGINAKPRPETYCCQQYNPGFTPVVGFRPQTSLSVDASPVSNRS